MTTMVRPPSERSADPREIAAERVAASNEASERFFTLNAERIAAACQAMAERFQRGGRLLLRGDRAQRSDVSHAVVEFLHPVIVGKRSLPAIALPNVNSASDGDALRTLGRPEDIVLVIGGVECTADDQMAVDQANDRGMLTLLLAGDDVPGHAARPTFGFHVPSRDPCIVQETHEMLYHILWELTHVFLEHRPVSA
jgi:D-sedoheptulose 7-phosphate isomerase